MSKMCLNLNDIYLIRQGSIFNKDSSVTDLVATENVYHSTFEVKFFNGKPQRQTGRWRLSNTPSIEALEKLYSYFESENELFTLADLHKK